MAADALEHAPHGSPDAAPRLPTRSGRRARLVRSLHTGLAVQALLTVAALVTLGMLRRSLGTLAGQELLLAASLAFLGPSCAGGLFAGLASPRVRWWQLLTMGAGAAAAFLALAATPAGAEALPPLLRGYLFANLLLDPVIAGALGSWLALTCRRRSA